MKRIAAITRCKGVLKAMFDRKGERIIRQVKQAIAMAEDKADLARIQAEQRINDLGSCASYDETSELSDRINAYVATAREANKWDEVAKILKDLEKKLNEEVEVEEEEGQESK